MAVDLTEPVSFLDDSAIGYGAAPELHVRRADLFTLDDVGRWEQYLTPPPDWLHFDLLPSAEHGGLIVAVCRSRASTTTPARTNINVSRTVGFDEPLPAGLGESSRRRTVLHNGEWPAGIRLTGRGP